MLEGHMKRPHLLILIMTSVLVLYSVYSLAAIIQVHVIDFELYSLHSKEFASKTKISSEKKRFLVSMPKDLLFGVVAETDDIAFLKEKGISTDELAMEESLDRYIFLYCLIGEKSYGKFNTEVEEIAQRGMTVEVKVAADRSDIRAIQHFNTEAPYFLSSMVRIDKSQFPIRGGLLFVFKDKRGNKTAEVRRVVD